MTVALYARISTRDNRQSAENQLREMRQFSAARGWEVYSEYIDQHSGAKDEQSRDALFDLMRDAHRGKFRIVLVFALDRFTREGVHAAFDYIHRLKSAGVQFVSVTEEHFSTQGPAGELFLAIAAWIAQQERIRLTERIKAGLERTKAKGTKLGRKRRMFDAVRAAEFRQKGDSWRTVARKLGISTGVLRRRLAVPNTDETGAPTTPLYKLSPFEHRRNRILALLTAPQALVEYLEPWDVSAVGEEAGARLFELRELPPGTRS